MSYDARRKLIPIPTVEQTSRFAIHVADNHSWYKNLPFFPPGASFIFFPNPYAGSGVKADGEQFIVYDVECADYFAHHSRLSTAEYVDQFGYWDYWVDSNPRVRDPVPGPWLYDKDGKTREQLADAMKQQWSCHLTAFLKPAPCMFTLDEHVFVRELEEFLASCRRPLHRLRTNLGSMQAEDPVIERYRVAADKMQFAGPQNCDLALRDFMESEWKAQRELLRETLLRTRAAWHPE